MIENRVYITAAAFASLAFNGMTYAFMGTSLPAIQSHLEIGIDLAGILMASFQTGVTVFSFIGGIMSDCYRRERILMGGCLVLCAGSMFLGVIPSYAVTLIVVWIMGAGMGCILSGSNTLLVSLYPIRKGMILNIHHVFFSIGSLIGPLIMGYLIISGNLWRQGFIGESIILLVLGVIFFFAGGSTPVSCERTLLGSQVGNLFKDKHFLLILIVCALSVGTQVTVMLLGVSFLIQAKQAALPTAGAALSLFALFMVLGRLVCGRLTMSVRHSTIIITLLWLQMATLALAWQGDGWLAVAALALSGFTFSGIFPTALALTGALYPHVEGSALGILSTTSGMGGVVLCWLTGYVAELANMRIGFMVMMLACISALVLFQINYKILARRESLPRRPDPYNKATKT